MTKEARTYNGEKTVSSVNGAGRTEQLHEKSAEFPQAQLPFSQLF